MIDTANKSGIFPAEIATVLQKFDGKFYKAEEYHQDYLEKNPGGYTCHRIREHWEFWKKKFFLYFLIISEFILKFKSKI